MSAETPTPTEKAAAKAAPTEAEYLTKQAQAASAAMGKSLDDAKAKLTQSLKGLTGKNGTGVLAEHPWLSIAAGAVAGFATGAAVMPSKTDAALKRLAAIERALNRPPAAAPGAAVDGNGRPAQPSVVNTLVKQVFGLLQPVLMSAITAGVTSKAVQDGSTPPPPEAAPADAGATTATAGTGI